MSAMGPPNRPPIPPAMLLDQLRTVGREAWATGYEQGVDDECQRVVAWLRRVGATVAADEIERGEHKKEE